MEKENKRKLNESKEGPNEMKVKQRKTKRLFCVPLSSFLDKSAVRDSDEALPLYQNTVPKSCGPLDILHTKFISLPVLTYKSDGPNKIALNSVKRKKRTREKKKTYFNFLRHMV